MLAATARAGGSLAKLLQRTAHNHVPLQARQVIDEQHPVEMVDLMLHTGGKKPFAGHHLLFAIDIQIAHIDAGRPFDLGGLFWDRQAAFLENGLGIGAGDNLRIDHLVKLRRVIRTAIHHNDPLRDIHLRRGKADSGGVIHGFGHVIEKLARAIGDLGNRRCHLAKHRVGDVDDRNQRHDS